MGSEYMGSHIRRGRRVAGEIRLRDVEDGTTTLYEGEALLAETQIDEVGGMTVTVALRLKDPGPSRTRRDVIRDALWMNVGGGRMGLEFEDAEKGVRDSIESIAREVDTALEIEEVEWN